MTSYRDRLDASQHAAVGKARKQYADRKISADQLYDKLVSAGMTSEEAGEYVDLEEEIRAGDV